MKVIDNLSDFEKPNFSVVTIGTFDGVHVGHQAILQQLIDEAHENQGKSVLVTFWPHPRFVLRGNTDLKLLSTFDEKIELLSSLGLDYLIKIPFTPEFASLTAEEFIQKVLVRGIGTKRLFIGYDHRFGNDRKGNLELLEQRAESFGYEVSEIPRQDIDSVGVSSTKIREALLEGDVELANTLLGREYTISGKVVEGQKLGREIGFPTANLLINEDYKLLPNDASYAVEVQLGMQTLKGMMNIGFKPTLESTKRTIEVHLFDFAEDIYEQKMTVRFVKSLRKEIKFESIEALKSQLEKDKVTAQKILR